MARRGPRGETVTVSVMVFTRDLRLADNPALTAAARALACYAIGLFAAPAGKAVGHAGAPRL